jgi:hypothetical protein
MAFMMDGGGHIFAALRWYKEKRPFPPNVVLELPALELTPGHLAKSFSVLPIDCIINGALLIKCKGTFWAVQSPREEQAYIRTNQIPLL